jgi:hypothetical protein
MYTQPIDRQHSGCILFLIDQSASMNEPFAGTTRSKSVELCSAVNRLIQNLVLRCRRGVEVRDYYHIGIIGYGKTVGPAFGGALSGQNLVASSVLADFPLRIVDEPLPEDPTITFPRPIWIEPKADGVTPMSAALNYAGSLLVDWANDHFNSFPPIVINVSDGVSTDGDPRPVAEQLRGIHTDDGNLLLFNINLSGASAASVEYPDTPVGLSPQAVTLFQMSSTLTPYMLAAARGMALPVRDAARGFVFNADPAKLSEFLDIGTRVSEVAEL